MTAQGIAPSRTACRSGGSRSRGSAEPVNGQPSSFRIARAAMTFPDDSDVLRADGFNRDSLRSLVASHTAPGHTA
jgi:hypothetical protein